MSDDTERRVLPVAEAELRVERRAGRPVIVGYAAVFGRRSGELGRARKFRETIAPGAFRSVLQSADVRALVNHNPDLILGRTRSGTLTLHEDEVGLRYEVDPPDSPIARHYLEAIERGDVTGSSFAFRHDDGPDTWDYDTDPPTRTLARITGLFDVGPVTYPAYDDASVEVAVRSMDRFRSDPAPDPSPDPTPPVPKARRLRPHLEAARLRGLHARLKRGDDDSA